MLYYCFFKYNKVNMKYFNKVFNLLSIYRKKMNTLKIFIFLLSNTIAVFSTETCFKTYQGQGNFNIAFKKIEGRNVALIFDAGIGSQQLHKKFQTTTVEEEAFLQPHNDETRSVGKSSRCSTFENSRLALSPFSQSQINKSFAAGSAQKYTDRTPVDNDISNFIDQHKVEYTFCFISHADRDHWNKIHLLPDDHPTFVFINGWIDVEKFNFDIIRRKNILLIDTSNFDSIINQGLGTIIQNYILKEEYNFISDYSNEDCSLLKEDLSYIVNGLNDVHFWALNPKAADQNGHSYVVSCRFPLINTSILCTGDATSETFQLLQKETMIDELAKEEKFQTFLMMPHHGSRHNISTEFLDFLKRATVNAFIVPSGNGAQYGHPSKVTIEKLQRFYEIRENYGPIENFWHRYTCFESKRVGSYIFERRDSEESGYNTELYMTKSGSVPFFGTNLMGTISLKNDGSWTAQKRILFTIENQQFEADLSKRSGQYNTIPIAFVSMGACEQFTVYKKTLAEYVLLLKVLDDNETPLYLEYILSPKQFRILPDAPRTLKGFNYFEMSGGLPSTRLF